MMFQALRNVRSKKVAAAFVLTFVMTVLSLGMTACASQQKGLSEVHVAADGNDESGKGTQSAPYATVSMAAKANPGSLIIVHGGEYGRIELG